jgi:hypothetical protein
MLSWKGSEMMSAVSAEHPEHDGCAPGDVEPVTCG